MRRTYRTVLLVLWWFAFKQVHAQYDIIPKPQLSLAFAGEFTLSHNYQIDCLSSDSFLRANLYHWVKTEAIKKAQVNKMVQTKIGIQLVGKKKWDAYLKKLTFKESFKPGEEGYVVKIDKNSILILAQTETGLFYGYQTLKQLFHLPSIACGEIYDKPSFAIRAWQDDISRGPIPTMKQLKDEIRELSAYKLNYFTLYTEHVFAYEKRPGIAPNDGITAAEIMELRQYAALYHVNLMANQQSFGHMEKVLALPKYAHLGEKEHILSPSKAETYTLLNDFYTEQNACYGGNYFMINADETFGLGTAQNKAMADSMGIGNLYAYHILQLYNLMKASGKTLVMWSDIVAKYPEIAAQLPKDMVQVPWAYHDAKSFKNMLEPLAQKGLEYWVAPGVNNWQNIYPNELVAKENIFNLVRDGYELGAKGVLNTTWDDDGYALFGNNWRGLIWGAALSWNAPKTNESSDNRWYYFNQAFDQQFWGLPLSQYQNALANLHVGKVEKALRNELFFEPIFPIYPSSIGEKVIQEQEGALALLLSIYKKVDSLSAFGSNQTLALRNFKFAIKEAQFSISKNLFKAHYQQFLDHWLGAAAILQELEQLQGNLQNISSDFEQLYIDENRPYYLTENLAKLSQLANHLKQIPDRCLVIASPKITAKGREITLLAPLSVAPIYYNFGKDQSLQLNAMKYKKPFYTKANLFVNCATLSGNTFNQVSTESYIYHKAIGKISAINIPYSKYHTSYSGGGFQALADGKIGSVKNLRSGLWQGYAGNDLELVLSFEKPTSIQEIEMAFYQNTPSWVILPKELELYTSNDGINYASIGSIQHQIPVQKEEAIRYVFKQQFPRFKTKYLKVIAKYYGPLPANHAGAGSASMIFADELIVR
jgi:hypothetical protein